MSEESFKKHRKDKIRKVAFEYLIAKQNNMQTKNVAYDTYLGIAPRRQSWIFCKRKAKPVSKQNE